jgi:hypothetical protein
MDHLANAARASSDLCLPAIFIASSDNTFDVFSLVSPSVWRAFSAFQTKLYVGLNDHSSAEPFIAVSAPVSGWRKELQFQLSALPEEHRYVVLLLDDFFIHTPMQLEVLAELVATAQRQNIDYIRLKPLERSWFVSCFRYLSARIGTEKLEKIRRGEPYYSSLQAAVWKRSYLLRLLEQDCSIWEFEHLVLPGSTHFAVRRSFGFKYEHLVEKGRWLRHAPKLLPGAPLEVLQARGFDGRRVYRYATLRKMKFAIYGYTMFKLKRALNLAFQRKM